MKKKQRSFEPHLAILQLSVPPGGEWRPEWSGWTLVQVAGGAGYCLHAYGSAELETGAVLVASDQAQTTFRASQLGALLLHTFNVAPARLTGLITLGEEDFFKVAALRQEHAVRTHPPYSPVAQKMKALPLGGSQAGLMFRLQLLQLFAEAFHGAFEQTLAVPQISDAKERLRALLQRTPPGEWAEMSCSELARETHCTSRHLSRIFRKLVGMSLRDKRAELRMARARELLATSRSKVVDVALESGYKSLSLFNLMFSRRFGTSPGRWRQQHNNHASRKNGRGRPAGF
ncbi:MAG: helix-turn-helix transcriptional regulator [Verrucomicrobiota bacterium]|nr:helix-turn-helix transcriptional regulator [Verrucomicrobiota bacterium]